MKLIFFTNRNNEYERIVFDQPYRKLWELYIDDNSATEIRFEATQAELKILSARDNQLTSILNVEEFSEYPTQLLPAIEELDLRENPLSSANFNF